MLYAIGKIDGGFIMSTLSKVNRATQRVVRFLLLDKLRVHRLEGVSLCRPGVDVGAIHVPKAKSIQVHDDHDLMHETLFCFGHFYAFPADKLAVVHGKSEDVAHGSRLDNALPW